jgi:hypothetical protein
MWTPICRLCIIHLDEQACLKFAQFYSLATLKCKWESGPIFNMTPSSSWCCLTSRC